ncbi:MAG: enoyl-CoA hydratase [Mycobacterium sp.]|uniref:enoyl-CoA hydratase n=1 Tax=Mycobacterium sp. TaxID=1785 RepID=UPI003F961ED4
MVALNQLVLLEDRGAVRVLTMNRPEARNALNTDLISALHAALIDADRDMSVRAVVLTGADPAFCAGLDLKQVQRDGAAYFERLHAENCITKVAQLSKPVLGAINGAAITGGMEMALGCDFLVASDQAVFADTHARVGILPGAGMTARLPGIIGAGMARRLSMTSEVIDASRAETMGLVTEVVAHTQLLNRIVELATQICEVSPPVMQGLKAMYVTGAAAIINPALAAEQTIATTVARHTDDLGERYRQVAERNRRQIRRPS